MSDKTIKTVKVKLLKPHTHGGVKFDAGMEIDMPEHDAKWLINTQTAQQSATKATTNKTLTEDKENA